eukprot:COSAG01_NODE_5660_length_4113_cov_20.206776_5_plen_70_part_00
MGGAELRGSCEDYFDDISYLLFVTDCRRLNTHFRPIAAGSDYMARTTPPHDACLSSHTNGKLVGTTTDK